jgi:arginine-tRNA-protein transferase
LPQQTWRLEYEQVAALSPAEYMERMQAGWRRFGDLLFRPMCPHCSACQSLRVLVQQFTPNRSQRRVWKANAGQVRVAIGTPAVTRPKLELYDRYHSFQSAAKGWSFHEPKNAEDYARSFVENPFATQEWCYFLDDELIGVGYVDDLPGGLSAIYFFYAPELRARALGTWNVLSIIDHARTRAIPHVYLGYFVPGCRSMAYKAGFEPNEVRGADGVWRARTDQRGSASDQ